MVSNIVSATRYWIQATFQPKQIIAELKVHPDKIAIAFWINGIFAILYTITALIYYAIGRLPAIPPWIPVAVEKYYLYQAFWTIPWALATWVMFSGIAHLLAIVGRNRPPGCEFENALVVGGLGWIVPSMILMWLPETILVPLFGVFWPAWVEMLRLMVIPPLWQSLLVAIGLRETHGVGWLRGLSIGVVTVLVFYVSFLAYMR